MSWKRLGVVFAPDGSQPWARSHAALPTPVHVAGDVFRFFTSSRDAERRSHVGWVDVEVSETPRVLNVAGEPILSPGADGAFDDSGVSIGCIAQQDGGIGLYYMGSISACARPGATRSALRGRNRCKAHSNVSRRAQFSTARLKIPTRFPIRLCFGSARRTGGCGTARITAAVGNADKNHAIKLARSRDGVNWTRDGATVVGFADEDEHALARPSVVKVGEKLLMCFACRGENYRIGAAVGRDGVNWTRCDAAMGLGPSSQGWDSEMTCYPALFWHRDRLWLAYNGNGYGATGFGLAVWEGALAL